MSQRKQFPAIGFARSTEVTKGKDGTAHPHFHALLMVEPGYFAGHSYMNQKNWTEFWQSCLQVDYTPVVNVKAVKPNKRWLADSGGELPAEQALAGAIVETFKYSVKPSDLIGQGTETDRQWLLQLTKQLEKTRAIALGGVFRKYLSESEPENLVGESEDGEDISASSMYFGWREMAQRYIKLWED
jgi:plasmid rolling circle replication initiator protein Rep